MPGNTANANVVVRSRKKGEKVYRDIQQQLDRLNDRVKTFGVVAGAAAAGGVALLARRGLENVDALAKQADKIGTTTDKLAALNHLSSLYVGTNINMAEALTKAQKRLGEFNATGGGAAAQWLQRLNLDTRELISLSPDELFKKYADEIRNLSSRGEQLAAISALMGDEARGAINIIDAGAGVFAEAEAEVTRFGVALNRVESAKVEAANDAIFRLQQRVDGAGNVIAARLAPVITAVANRFIDSGAEADAFGRTVDKVVDGAALGFGLVLDALHGLKLLFQVVRIGALEFAGTVVGGMANIEGAVIRVGNKMRDVFGGEQIDPANTTLANIEASLDASADAARRVLSELAQTERPSIALGRGLAQARIDAENLARAAAESRERLQEIVAPTFDENLQDERAQERDALLAERQLLKRQKELEGLTQHLATREQIEAMAHARRLEMLQTAVGDEIISEKRANAIRIALEKKFVADVGKIRAADEKQQEAQRKVELAATVGHLAGILDLVTSNSRTGFEIKKAAGIATATINAIQGASETIRAYPWPLAGVLAATHLAKGYALVDQIRSQSFAGGGRASIAGGGGAATAPVQVESASPAIAPDTAPTEVPQQSIEVHIHGDVYDKVGFERVLQETVGDLVDRDVILIPAASRQASAIRSG